MTRAAAPTIDHPFFARVWSLHVAHEAKAIPILRRENVAGLSGRCWKSAPVSGPTLLIIRRRSSGWLPSSPNHGWPPEPASRLPAAPVAVEVIGATAEEFDSVQQFDAVVCSFVLCSVCDPAGVLQRLHSLLLPGGELRYLEHVASAGARGRWQRFLDATVWPRFLGNCHSHRDTERAVLDAGFEVHASRREWSLAAWSPMPVSELTLARARRVL